MKEKSAKGFSRPSSKRVWTRNIAWVLVLVLVQLAMPWAQEMPVPVEVQFVLFAKILSFDRNLDSGKEAETSIGILYQQKYRPSLLAKKQFMEAVAAAGKDAGIRFRCIPIGIHDQTDLRDAVAKHDVDVLYIAPLRSVQVKDIISVSRERRVTTLTGVPEYVEAGLAVGIGAKAEKPRILVNVNAAKAEGADFKARLLKMAKVIE